jgi:hypothetical protein
MLRRYTLQVIAIRATLPLAFPLIQAEEGLTCTEAQWPASPRQHARAIAVRKNREPEGFR